MPAVHPRVIQSLNRKWGASGAEVAPGLRAWYPLQTFCAATPVDDQLLLIRECGQSEDLIALSSTLRGSRVASSWLNDLLNAVDSTGIPLPLWIQGLTLLVEWESIHHPESKPDLNALNGFLSCCAEYQHSQTVRIDFIDTVRQLLRDHGIEGG